MDRRRITTLIVDDEPVARRVLREGLELIPEIEIIGEAANGRDALQQIAILKPDLVFLDLQMPVMSGFEVVRSLGEPPLPVIVIVTAFDQHAVQAFEAGAIDYLLKPVTEARLQKSVERAASLLNRLPRSPIRSPASPPSPPQSILPGSAKLSAAADLTMSCWMPMTSSPFKPNANWSGSSPRSSAYSQRSR
jgi:DNA-binding LytR/AlgR family response regulator